MEKTCAKFVQACNNQKIGNMAVNDATRKPITLLTTFRQSGRKCSKQHFDSRQQAVDFFKQKIDPKLERASIYDNGMRALVWKSA